MAQIWLTNGQRPTRGRQSSTARVGWAERTWSPTIPGPLGRVLPSTRPAGADGASWPVWKLRAEAADFHVERPGSTL